MKNWLSTFRKERFQSSDLRIQNQATLKSDVSNLKSEHALCTLSPKYLTQILF